MTRVAFLYAVRYKNEVFGSSFENPVFERQNLLSFFEKLYYNVQVILVLLQMPVPGISTPELSKHDHTNHQLFSARILA